MVNNNQHTIIIGPIAFSWGVSWSPSNNYWQIDREWYYFTNFLPHHHGGVMVLQLVWDRFEDCTFAFKAHRLNFSQACMIIFKYKVLELTNCQVRLIMKSDLNNNLASDQAVNTGVIAAITRVWIPFVLHFMFPIFLFNVTCMSAIRCDWWCDGWWLLMPIALLYYLFYCNYNAQ